MLRIIVLALSLCVAANAFASGGWTNGEVKDVDEIARWSTKMLSSMSGFEGEYTIQTPKNIQKQVVAGVNYKFQLDVVHRDLNGKYTFKTCDLYVFEQTWTNTRQFVEAPVCKASPSLERAGQWQQVSVVTQDILEVARLTAKQMNAQLGFAGEHNVAKVYNVQKQIVNGINYKFTVEFLVAAEGNQFSKVCDMFINHQSWNNNKITFTSSPVCRANPQFPFSAEGGWTQQTVVSDEVMELARWSASQLAQFTGIQGEHTAMTARNVQTQLVNGVNYKFTLDVLCNDAAEGKYYFKSCDMFIYKTFSGQKSFSQSPKCVAHANFE